jgi:hypothetical protein
MTCALQWQSQSKIGLRDTQIRPPNHASTQLNCINEGKDFSTKVEFNE